MKTVRIWWLFLDHETLSITFFIPLLCLLKLDIFILWLFSAISSSISVKVTHNPWTTTQKIFIFLLLFYMLYLKTWCSWSLIKSRKIKMCPSKNIGMGCLDNAKSTLPSHFCLVAKINLSQTDAVGEGHLACGNCIFWYKMFSPTLHAAFFSRFSVCSIYLRAPARCWLWEACEYSLVLFQINFSRCTNVVL